MYIDRLSNSGVVGVRSEPTTTATPREVPPEAPGLMPELRQLACSGDPGAMLAALTMQAAKSEREVSRAQRDNAERMQEQDEAREIHDLRDKADLERIQGLVDGAMQIGSAVCDFISARKAAGENKKAAADWSFAGAVTKGSEAPAEGCFKGAITDKDTDAKLHDMAAQSAKRMVEDARSDESDAKQLMEKALEFYKEYSETRAQTMMAATHRA